MRTPETTSAADAIQAQLQGLPPEAKWFIRDLIRGLEAEAGTARALSVRAELAAARAKQRAEAAVAAAEAERDRAVAAAREVGEERDALRRRVEELEHSGQRAPGRARR